MTIHCSLATPIELRQPFPVPLLPIRPVSAATRLAVLGWCSPMLVHLRSSTPASAGTTHSAGLLRTSAREAATHYVRQRDDNHGLTSQSCLVGSD